VKILTVHEVGWHADSTFKENRRSGDRQMNGRSGHQSRLSVLKFIK